MPHLTSSVDAPHSIDSDRHNFGRRCQVELPYILKPRCLFPEFQLFAQSSSLRSFLKKARAQEFSLLPYLQFGELTFAPTLNPQAMEYLDVQPLKRKLSDEEIIEIGAILGLMLAMGVSDLHPTNILFGECNGRAVYAPIDLELFMVDYTFDGKGFLHPESPHYSCCSISSQFHQYLQRFPDRNFSSKLYYGLREILELLHAQKNDFYQALYGKTDISSIPIRVIQQRTMVYSEMIAQQDFKNCSASEVRQLSRGDIPYYFTFLGDQSLYEWTADTTYAPVVANSHTFSPYPSVPFSADLLNPQHLLTLFLSLDGHLGKELPEMTGHRDICIIHTSEHKRVITKDFNIQARSVQL